MKISKENLLGMLPQRSMVNSSKLALLGKTFIMAGMVEDENIEADLETPNNDAGRVRYRFTEEGGSNTVIISVRQLLFMNTTLEDTIDAENYEAEATETNVLHAILAEKMKGSEGEDTCDLPEKITVVDVQDAKREGSDGKQHKAYPAYMYEKFAARSKGLTGDKLGELYRDFDLMSSLPGSQLLSRFDKPETEAIKTLVVNSYIETA